MTQICVAKPAANHCINFWLCWSYSCSCCSFQSCFITLNHTDNNPPSATIILILQKSLLPGFGYPKPQSQALHITHNGGEWHQEQALCPKMSTATSSSSPKPLPRSRREVMGYTAPIPMSKMLWFPSGFVGTSSDAAIGLSARRCGRC